MGGDGSVEAKRKKLEKQRQTAEEELKILQFDINRTRTEIAKQVLKLAKIANEISDLPEPKMYTVVRVHNEFNYNESSHVTACSAATPGEAVDLTVDELDNSERWTVVAVFEGDHNDVWSG